MSWILHYENIRPQQQEAIDFFKKSKKRFLIYELPTWSWKSPLWVFLWTQFSKSYILTSQKILQEQYYQDFWDRSYFAMIKWVKNYYCSLNWENAKNWVCASVKWLKKQCSEKWICDYLEKLKLAIDRQVTNSNYSYFFYINQQWCKPTLKARDCLICDEAHNIEKEIINYVTFSVSEELLESIWIKNEKIPYYKEQWKYKNWLIELNKKIEKRKEFLNKEIEWIIWKYYSWFDIENWRLSDKQLAIITNIVFEQTDSILLDHLQWELDFIDKTWVKIRKFAEVYHEETWIWNIDYSEQEKKINSIEFKPITIKKISHDVLFDFWIKKVILLSWTILNKKYFCESLWIWEDEADFLRLDTDFPLENRKVKLLNIWKMSMENKKQTLPKIISVIEEILDKNKWKKWIIHTHTYEIQRYILDNINPIYKTRLLHNWSSDHIDFTIQKHIFSPKDTVLLSPSMSEWVDLKWKSSEFQIIVKLPFPYLWDKYVREKLKVQWKYTSYEMFKKFMQSCWRSIRSKNDYCETYVLDSSAWYYVKRDKELLPQWFIDWIEFDWKI